MAITTKESILKVLSAYNPWWKTGMVSAPIADDDAIVELCEESSAAIIITKNADDFGVHNTKCGKDLLRIPAFAFLYLLGNAEKHGYRGIEQ